MLKKPRTKWRGFTLVEIVIMVVMLAMLAALAVPALIRARHRSQAAKVQDELRTIDSAIDQYAIEDHKKINGPLGAPIDKDFKGNAVPFAGKASPGDDYGDQRADRFPNLPEETFETLSGASPAPFWSSSNP